MDLLRAAFCSLLLILFPVAIPASGEPAPTPLLRWFHADVTPSWILHSPSSSRVGTGAGPKIEYRAEPWFERIGDLTISIIGADRPFTLADNRGKVVLLDFWATWCGPCRQELPALQRLWEEERESGLVVVAVNMEEPDKNALAMARELGITLPIGRSNRSIKKYVRARTLPTVVLIDQEGRIRKRWNGYKEGLDLLIRREIHSLQAGDPAGEAKLLGTSLRGGGRMTVEWSRKLPAKGAGIATIHTPSGSTALVVSSGGELLSYRSDGKFLVRFPVPAGMEQLKAIDLTGDGVEEVVGFRRGSRRIGVVDFATRAATHWEAPEGVLSVSLSPGADGQPGSILVGTVQHLYQIDLTGSVLSENPGGALDVALSPGDGAMALLDPERRLYRFNEEGTSTGRTAALPGAWLLLADGAGIGIGSERILAMTAGSFQGNGAREVVLASGAGELLLVEEKDGRLQEQVSWPGIRNLLVLDLDQDGRDELIVLSGDRLTALSFR